jgi:hypothetical protein
VRLGRVGQARERRGEPARGEDFRFSFSKNII